MLGSGEPWKASLKAAMVYLSAWPLGSSVDLVVLFLARRPEILEKLANFREGQVNPLSFHLN